MKNHKLLRKIDPHILFLAMTNANLHKEDHIHPRSKRNAKASLVAVEPIYEVASSKDVQGSEGASPTADVRPPRQIGRHISQYRFARRNVWWKRNDLGNKSWRKPWLPALSM